MVAGDPLMDGYGMVEKGFSEVTEAQQLVLGTKIDYSQEPLGLNSPWKVALNAQENGKSSPDGKSSDTPSGSSTPALNRARSSGTIPGIGSPAPPKSFRYDRGYMPKHVEKPSPEVLRLTAMALHDLERSMVMGGHDPHTLCNIGFLLDAIMDDFPTTQLLYEYALYLHPTHPRLNYYFGKHLQARGRTLTQLGNYREALRIMLRARTYYLNASRLTNHTRANIVKDMANMHKYMHFQIGMSDRSRKEHIGVKKTRDIGAWTVHNHTEASRLYKLALEISPTHTLAITNASRHMMEKMQRSRYHYRGHT